MTKKFIIYNPIASKDHYVPYEGFSLNIHYMCMVIKRKTV